MALFAMINCSVNVPYIFMAIVGNSLLLAAFITTPAIRSPSSAFFAASLSRTSLCLDLFIRADLIILNLKNLCLKVCKPNPKLCLVVTWYRPLCSSVDLFSH